MSCLLRVKRPSCTGGCQEKNRPTIQRVGPHLGPSTSGQFIPSQLDFTVRAACNRRGAAFSTLARSKYAPIRKKGIRANASWGLLSQ
ncbi:unnamed protein product [Lasius platythorax]|uniref:Uncharacterized protein n=1 Tax=Lasius platythorax TaxID=488582 RepID=A0AAV2NKT1_9HYME